MSVVFFLAEMSCCDRIKRPDAALYVTKHQQVFMRFIF